MLADEGPAVVAALVGLGKPEKKPDHGAVGPPGPNPVPQSDPEKNQGSGASDRLASGRL